MGQEEQIEEREVLDYISPDEIPDRSGTSYRVTIILDIPRQDDDATEPTTLLLKVSYPSSYPDTAPDLDIFLPPNTPKQAHFDLSVSKPVLLSTLPPLIADSLGLVMIFTLISHLKESAEQAVADAEKRRAEEEEDNKFSGRRVTEKSFGEWRLAFRKEIREREEEKVRRREEGGDGAREKAGGEGR